MFTLLWLYVRVFPRLMPFTCYVFTLRSDWFTVLFASVVIGQSVTLVLFLMDSVGKRCKLFQVTCNIFNVLFNADVTS